MRYQKFLGFNLPKLGSIEKLDFETNEFSQLRSYKALKQRFIYDMPWEKTDYFEKFQKQTNSRKPFRGRYTSWASFEKQLQAWENLYHSIKQLGYIKQSSLLNNPLKEIEIIIDKHGDPIFLDGRHRLIIAKILNIEFVYVVVKAIDIRFYNNLIMKLDNRMPNIDDIQDHLTRKNP